MGYPWMSHVPHENDVFVIIFGTLVVLQFTAAFTEKVHGAAKQRSEGKEAHGKTVQQVAEPLRIVEPAVASCTAVHVPHQAGTVHECAVDQRVRNETCILNKTKNASRHEYI